MKNMYAIRVKKKHHYNEYPMFVGKDMYITNEDVVAYMKQAYLANEIVLFDKKDNAEKVKEKITKIFENFDLEVVDVVISPVIVTIKGMPCVGFSPRLDAADNEGNGWE